MADNILGLPVCVTWGAQWEARKEDKADGEAVS